MTLKISSKFVHSFLVTGILPLLHTNERANRCDMNRLQFGRWLQSPFDFDSIALRPFYVTAYLLWTAALRHKQAVGGSPPRYATAPVRAARCGPAPAHTRLTPGLRRPTCLASGSCGRHEYSRCTRQTSDVRQTDVRQKHSLMPPPIRGGA